MVKHLEIDQPADAPARKKPGRKPNVKPMVPDAAHAGPVATAPVRRNNPRPATREATHELAREPSRSNSTVLGRNGEPLARRRTNNAGDIFDRVKPPPGWSFQWNAVTAVNKEIAEIHQGAIVDLHENGWRPVPASRYPGVWTPPGYDGEIIVQGQRLEERPAELTRQALEEDELRARAQLRTQTDSLRLTQSKLPGATAGRAQQVSGIRMEIDKSLELPPGALPIDGTGE